MNLLSVGAAYRLVWRLFGAALGIGVAALGQVVIMSERVFDYPILTPLADAVFDVFANPTTVLLGAILLVVGAVLFAASIKSESQTDDSEAKRLGPDILTVRLPRSRLFVGTLLLAATLHGYLWLKLATDNYERSYPLLYFAGIGLVAAALLYLDRRSGISFKFRVGVLEVAFVAAVTGAFIAINLWDLTSWYYTADSSYSIYTYARSIAEGAPRNFFSQTGPRPWEAAMQYHYVAAVMKAFGINYFGWKLASTLAGAAIFVPLYVLVRTLFNVRTAVAAAGLLVAAHVLLAFAHFGWLTLGSIFPSVLAFALFFVGVKRGSALFIFGAGVAAGLGFYVFMTARITVPVLLAFLVLLFLLRYRFHLVHNLGFLFLGLVLAVAPLFITSGTDVISEMSRESIFNYRNPDYVPNVWDRATDNLVQNSFAFNSSGGTYKEREIYTTGSLLEPITAVLAVLGLAYAIKRFRTPPYLFLLTWFAISMVALGVNSPHPSIPVVRLSYAVPLMGILAAIALGVAYPLVQHSLKNKALRTVIPPMLLCVLLVAVLASNLYRFWDVAPNARPSSTRAVVMKAALSDECRSSDRQTVVVTEVRGGTLLNAIEAWKWGQDRVPVVLAFEEMDRVKEFAPTSCVIYQPSTYPPPAEDIARLQRLTGIQEITYEHDQTATRSVVVLK